MIEITKDQGLSGLELLSGIPGSLGGAIMGNAGAWGDQIGELVEEVRVLDIHQDLLDCVHSFVLRHVVSADIRDNVDPQLNLSRTRRRRPNCNIVLAHSTKGPADAEIGTCGHFKAPSTCQRSRGTPEPQECGIEQAS